MVEDIQHRQVGRQDFGFELAEAFLPADLGEAPQQAARNPLPLILLFDREGEFRAATRHIRIDGKITYSANHYLVLARSGRDEQRYVLLEVDVRDVGEFGLGDGGFVAEIPVVDGRAIKTLEGFVYLVAVVRTDRPHGDDSSVLESL